MGSLLFFVATLLYIPLSVINMAVVLYKNSRVRGFFRVIDSYLYEEAYAIDVFANRSFRTLWNTILKKRGGYSFGKSGETISSALGKNKRDGTLSIAGKLLDWVLNMFDKNHSIKSINDKL